MPCARGVSASMHVKAGLTRVTAETGAVTLIQRFGSALNLNIHFQILFLDGVYVTADGGPFFRRVKPPTSAEMEKLIHRTSSSRRSLSGARRVAGAGHGEQLPDAEGDCDADRLVEAPGLSVLRSEYGTSLCHSSLYCGIAATSHQRAKRERL